MGNFTVSDHPFMQINENDEVLFSISTEDDWWAILDKDLTFLESNDYSGNSAVPFAFGSKFDLAFSERLYYLNDDLVIQDIKDVFGATGKR